MLITAKKKMCPCITNIHAPAHTSPRQFTLYHLFSYISLLSRIQVLLTFFSQKVEGWMPWAIGNGRLNTSPKLDAYTSTPSTPSSMAALFLTEGCLFSGKASSLDAFRSYPRQLSCSACPVGQLDRPEAALPCSSRTRGNFPSDNHAPVRQRPTCLTTV